MTRRESRNTPAIAVKGGRISIKYIDAYQSPAEGLWKLADSTAVQRAVLQKSPNTATTVSTAAIVAKTRDHVVPPTMKNDRIAMFVAPSARTAKVIASGKRGPVGARQYATYATASQIRRAAMTPAPRRTELSLTVTPI